VPDSLRLTYIGGPTLLIEWRGLRLLTDPTFDPAGTSYPTAVYTLRKTIGPAVGVEQIGPIDAILLSHDHHFDNLDHAGRALLPLARQVLTTRAGAERLDGNAVGLDREDLVTLENAKGEKLRVYATAARHGPAGGDRGPVIGFLLRWMDDTGHGLYLTGDSVWFEGLEAIRELGPVRAVIAFAGAAKVQVAGDQPLTLTAQGTVELARLFAPAPIVPVHFEGWEHFSESRADLELAFQAAGLSERLRWLPPGRPVTLAP
jgi:L-ascorbate metabolism protein UlaG (beta-lactamase superfamily)